VKGRDHPATDDTEFFDFHLIFLSKASRWNLSSKTTPKPRRVGRRFFDYDGSESKKQAARRFSFFFLATAYRVKLSETEKGFCSLKSFN
jgi:hypothetical protein